MAENYPVYIMYTSHEKYQKIKKHIVSTIEDQVLISKYNHTLFIVSEIGLPEKQSTSCNMYLGSQSISDIINLNLFTTIDIIEDVSTGFLTVNKKGTTTKDTLIGNSSKLYIYCRYNITTNESFFNIYYYNDNSAVYIPITQNGIFSYNVNYVSNIGDISDRSAWQNRTLVYYPQT